MDNLLRDVKHSLRMLLKSPGFTLIAVLSLALGIGPNTAIFSVVNSVLLRAPEGREPERLLDIYNRGEDGRWFFSGYGVVERLREGGGEALEGVAAWVANRAALEEDGVPQPVFYELVTGNYFDVLGIAPAHGRFFAPEEDATPGTHPVAVVSDGFFERRLGGDPERLGSEVRINGRPYTVIGVAPQGFTGKAMPGLQADLWLPYHMYPHLSPSQARSGNLGITARVRPDVAPATAMAAVSAIGARIDADRKAEGSETDFVLRAFPWTEIYIHPTLDGPLVAGASLLLVVVGLVLLVACINLAGFLLARGTDRRREVAIRLALGASRGAVARQLLVESVLLALAGGALGLALGSWTARALASVDVPLPFPVNLDLALDARVLTFTVGISLLAGLLFGLTPALQATRAPVAGVLRDESGAVAGQRGKVSLRGALVGAQMALSVVLLVGAGLFVRSLAQAGSIDPGFDTGPAAVVDVSGSNAGYESGAEMLPALEAALAELRTRPAVRAAAYTTRMPLTLGVNVGFYEVPGAPPPPNRDEHRIEQASASPAYFEAMDIGLVRGRGFSEADHADAAPVAVVSRALAEALWPEGPAIGRTLIPVRDRADPLTVVGVVEDVKVWSLQEAPRPYLYRPLAQAPSTSVHLIVRGDLPPTRLGQEARAALAQADPELFVPRIATMREHLSYVLFLPRMAAYLIGGFALLALGLSAMGLWGIVSYGVARRTREMGIRISLGAQAGDVVRLVLRGGLLVAGIGALAGIAGAFVVARLLGGFLIGVRPWDPVTFTAVPALLLLVAATAAFLPAQRASRVDPVEALRGE